MRTLTIGLLFSSLIASTLACQGGDDGDAAPRPTGPLIEQMAPPLDLKAPPADGTKTASGLVFSKLAVQPTGAQLKLGETALVHYTGWRQSTGETFFTTRGRGQPIALDVAHAALGFRETLPLLRKGEKVIVWIPPGEGVAETLVYEIELLDIISQPAVPGRSSGDAPPARAGRSAGEPALSGAAGRANGAPAPHFATSPTSAPGASN